MMAGRGIYFLVLIVCASCLGAGCASSDQEAETKITGTAADVESNTENRANYRFHIDEWIPRFSLDPNVERYSGDIITGPSHVGNNELLRRGMQDQYVWGPPMPVDVFVMADGEPLHRDVTKLGGLPYRPAEAPWPTNEKGEPLLFLGQFNFADSKDITGNLPGDILLVFADRQKAFSKAVVFEWQKFGLGSLVTAQAIPAHPHAFKPCYGHIWRTANYPHAKDLAGPGGEKYPKCHGKDVWSSFLIPKFQATQIRPAPFFIQGDPELPGRMLCTISSVQPDQHKPFPWVNRADPLMPEGKWDHRRKSLMIGDMGCLYISIDDKGQLHWREQCY